MQHDSPPLEQINLISIVTSTGKPVFEMVSRRWEILQGYTEPGARNGS